MVDKTARPFNKRGRAHIETAIIRFVSIYKLHKVSEDAQAHVRGLLRMELHAHHILALHCRAKRAAINL